MSVEARIPDRRRGLGGNNGRDDTTVYETMIPDSFSNRGPSPPQDATSMDSSSDESTQMSAVSTILNSLDSLVYVADMQTHELLFVNDYGKSIWGRDIEGKLCWRVLQDTPGPCDFCTNECLIDGEGKPTGVYVWEFRNTVDGRWYQCRDQAIRWVDGRLVRMEIATDITERKVLEEDLAEAKRRAEALSRTDELTGLHNRRGFFELSAQPFRQARRSGNAMAVAMLDLDFFKSVNDRYGHFAGDEVLRKLARVVDTQIRASDIPGRIGGEEFVLALPDTDLSRALEFAERLRADIAATEITLDDNTLRCTVSIGVAVLTDDCPSIEALLARADNALFRAKANGRNRVEYAR